MPAEIAYVRPTKDGIGSLIGTLVTAKRLGYQEAPSDDHESYANADNLSDDVQGTLIVRLIPPYSVAGRQIGASYLQYLVGGQLAEPSTIAAK